MRWKKQKAIRKGSALKSIYIERGKIDIEKIMAHKFFQEMENEQQPRRTTEVMYINFQTLSGRSFTIHSALNSKFTKKEVEIQLQKGLDEIEQRYKEFKEFGDFKKRPRAISNRLSPSDAPFKKESINKITFNYVN